MNSTFKKVFQKYVIVEQILKVIKIFCKKLMQSFPAFLLDVN